MPLFISTDDAGFDAAFEALLGAKRELDPDVDAEVSAIIADVKARGDAAVIERTRLWDKIDLSPEQLEISEEDIDAAISTVPGADRAALELAHDRITAFHLRQRPENAWWTDATGAQLGWRWTAISKVGLYVPGGSASYPSSVLMNAVPARVAGVDRVVMCVPTPGGLLNPLVLLAARLAGVHQVFRIGGAQAIAALAYGTAKIPAVDKITGPGNAWVAAAKRRVFGWVGIDMIAGPSEVLVIADGQNDPDWIALDLLSQAEHDEAAQSILITDDSSLGGAVAASVERRLLTLQRKEIARVSWRAHGAILVVRNMAEAVRLSDRIAPEHLQICTANPEALAERIKHAGAIFLGSLTPEAIGDYVAGPNHVLPTSRSARYASGLSVFDFLKRTTLTRMSAASLGAIGPSAARLAQSESLEAHGLSVDARLVQLGREGAA